MARVSKTPLVDPMGPILGTDGDDVIVGTIFADTFIGSRGNDTIHGLAGDDTVSYENAPFVTNENPDGMVLTYLLPGVEVDLEAGTALKHAFLYPASPGDPVIHETFTDRLISIENVIGSGGVDTIRGSTANNVLSGLNGDDTIEGRDGNDTLSGDDGRDSLFGGAANDVISGGSDSDFLAGGAGADRINGGADGGDIYATPGTIILPDGISAGHITAVQGDFVSYGSSLAGVDVDLNRTLPQIGGDAQGDQLSNIESVLGSSFDDTITVGGGHAFGSFGNDLLYGGVASEVLIGGVGGDKLFGGDGDDLLAGNDYGEFSLLGNFDLTPDELYGGSGNDILIGGAGADLLNGGRGHDVYYMVESDDILRDVGGNDTVVTDESIFSLAADFENLVFNDTGDPAAHTGYGNATSNILVGGYGDDTLFAGAGADTLDGGAGNDVFGDLIGNDTITMSEGTDLVLGFGATAGRDHDVIDLSNYGYAHLRDFYSQGGTITQVGKDTQIQLYDGGPTLVLQGVAVGTIDETDFYFG